jgi:hypothetical protein
MENMQVGDTEHTVLLDSEALIQRVADTTTLDGGVNVYSECEVKVMDFAPNDVFPSALYVLRDNVATVEEIRADFLRVGIDILYLSEVVSWGNIVIGPPVVEFTDGLPTIVDGIHRFYYAMQNRSRISALCISEPRLPLISYPVSWDEVVEYCTKPEDPSLLRRLRFKDEPSVLRHYYRDLSYLGSKGRRPRAGQES